MVDSAPPSEPRPPSSSRGPWIAIVIVLVVVGGLLLLKSKRTGDGKSGPDAAATSSVKERYKNVSRPSSDPELGRELIPGAGQGAKLVNEAGYFGKMYPKEKGSNAYRVLGFGGPNSMYYAAEGENWVSLLDKALAPQHPGKTVEVLDFAVDGETLKSAVHRIRTLGVPYKPDLVVIGFAPDQIADLKGAISNVTKTPVNDVSGPEGAAGMPALYKFLSTSREVKQAFYDAIFTSPQWRDSVMALNDLEHLSQANGFSVVIVALPILSSFEPYQFQPLHDAIRVQAERHKFTYVDLAPEFTKHHDLTEFREPDDVLNYSPKGHAIVAEAVKQALEKKPEPEPEPKK